MHPRVGGGMAARIPRRTRRLSALGIIWGEGEIRVETFVRCLASSELNGRVPSFPPAWNPVPCPPSPAFKEPKAQGCARTAATIGPGVGVRTTSSGGGPVGAVWRRSAGSPALRPPLWRPPRRPSGLRPKRKGQRRDAVRIQTKARRPGRRTVKKTNRPNPILLMCIPRQKKKSQPGPFWLKLFSISKKPLAGRSFTGKNSVSKVWVGKTKRLREIATKKFAPCFLSDSFKGPAWPRGAHCIWASGSSTSHPFTPK